MFKHCLTLGLCRPREATSASSLARPPVRHHLQLPPMVEHCVVASHKQPLEKAAFVLELWLLLNFRERPSLSSRLRRPLPICASSSLTAQLAVCHLDCSKLAWMSSKVKP